MRADLPEVIRQERRVGKTDDEIAVIFQRSRLPLPEGPFHHHSRVSIRALMNEDPAGARGMEPLAR